MKSKVAGAKYLDLQHQEVINVNSVRMTVLNTARHSFIARPEGEPVFMVKGIACKLKKMLANGDYVLEPLDKSIEVFRIDNG